MSRVQEYGEHSGMGMLGARRNTGIGESDEGGSRASDSKSKMGYYRIPNAKI